MFRIERPDPTPVEVEKRRYLTKLEKAELCLRQNGHCAVCGQKLRAGAIDYDHTIPLALGGSQDLSNWQAICRGTCHKDKTKTDQAAIAKAKRLSGETGQRARRERNGSKFGIPGLVKRMSSGKVEKRTDQTSLEEGQNDD